MIINIQKHIQVQINVLVTVIGTNINSSIIPFWLNMYNFKPDFLFKYLVKTVFGNVTPL